MIFSFLFNKRRGKQISFLKYASPITIAYFSSNSQTRIGAFSYKKHSFSLLRILIDKTSTNFADPFPCWPPIKVSFNIKFLKLHIRSELCKVFQFLRFSLWISLYSLTSSAQFGHKDPPCWYKWGLEQNGEKIVNIVSFFLSTSRWSFIIIIGFM